MSLFFQQHFQDGGTAGSQCPSITLADLTEPYAVVDEVFSDTVAPVGGTAPYSLSVTVGSLPTGLSLNASTGAITGTPTTFQTSNFTIGGTDANGCSVTPKSYTIEVQYADMLDYITRVQAAGSDITGDVLTAYANFISGTTGLRSKFIRFSLFAADDFAGIFEPVYIGPDISTPLGNTSDTNNNFVSGDWDLLTGLTGDGLTTYLQTGITASSISEIAIDDVGICVSVQNIPPITATRFDIGANTSYLNCDNSGDIYLGINSSPNSPGITPATGFLWGGRQNGTDIEVTLNGSDYSFAAATTSEAFTEYAVFAIMFGGPSNFSNRTLYGYGITKYLTTGERAALKTAIDNFNTDLGR